MESIEQLTENYKVANELLKSSPLYIAKEVAGAALQAAHEAAKQERVAARVAAHAAKLTNWTAVPVIPATEEFVRDQDLSTESAS